MCKVKILMTSQIVARKLAVHKQRNKKNAGNILGMGSLKYTFDKKLLTNESNAVQRGGICIQNFAAHQKIQIINFQTFFFIFNFSALTLDKTILKQRREFGISIFFVNKKDREKRFTSVFFLRRTKANKILKQSAIKKLKGESVKRF